ncbi:hypothetical protein QBC46DRAFT_378768 [Diplogelasinospora grovesii]|uniref:Uncharacterized protein n=1 Tax=Diplogelasinospora grovesii TaxID=303347 RepID=A0AAN6NCQ6_9PEZI|nr:hypothetical protein QBC46DRAFT_378768 [Diplogelasinospora grovesii]
MSSFSRGLRAQLPRLMQTTPLFTGRCSASSQSVPLRLVFRIQTPSQLPSSARRLFQTSCQRLKAAAAAAPKTTPAARTTAPKPNNAAPLLNATRKVPATFAEQLAFRGQPTLLYEAPSHFWYTFSSFAAGTFCVVYTVYQYWTVYLYPPEGLHWLVPQAFGLICMFMAGMGAYFVLGTTRIVRTLRAVPASTLTSKAAKAGAATTPIMIEVATRRLIPFLPYKKALLHPEEVQLPFRMQGVLSNGQPGGAAGAGKRLSAKAEIEAKKAEREAKEKARQYQLDHIMTAPFRDAKRSFSLAWQGIRRSFYRDGFAKIKLGKKGQEFKLDVSGGWALDDGRAMDRLLAVRPNAMRS